MSAFGENLDVGQASGDVDRDVHVLPADDLAPRTLGVGARAGVAPASRGDAMPSAVLDAPELLDVDVDQLARTSRS